MNKHYRPDLSLFHAAPEADARRQLEALGVRGALRQWQFQRAVLYGRELLDRGEPRNLAALRIAQRYEISTRQAYRALAEALNQNTAQPGRLKP